MPAHRSQGGGVHYRGTVLLRFAVMTKIPYYYKTSMWMVLVHNYGIKTDYDTIYSFKIWSSTT